MGLGAYGDAVQDHRQVLPGDLLGAVVPARPVPGRRDPHRVADEAVGEPYVQVVPEGSRGDPALQRPEPRLLELLLGVGEIAEAGLGGEVPGLLLVDGDGSAVPVDVLNTQLRGFKPTFYDPGETSSYALTVMCESGCTPPEADEASSSRKPPFAQLSRCGRVSSSASTPISRM